MDKMVLDSVETILLTVWSTPKNSCLKTGVALVYNCGTDQPDKLIYLSSLVWMTR